MIISPKNDGLNDLLFFVGLLVNTATLKCLPVRRLSLRAACSRKQVHFVEQNVSPWSVLPLQYIKKAIDKDGSFLYRISEKQIITIMYVLLLFYITIIR